MIMILDRLIGRERSASDKKDRETSRLNVVIYTRRLCHRCLPIVSLLESRRQRFGFTLDLIDIDSDPDLASRMGVGVPVLGADGVMWFRGGSGVPIVTINGKIRFRGAVNPVLLDRLLHAEAALASSEPTP